MSFSLTRLALTGWPDYNTIAVSLLALSDGSQANKVISRGTDLKLALVTLAVVAAVEAAQPDCTHFTPTANKFYSLSPFYVIFVDIKQLLY